MIMNLSRYMERDNTPSLIAVKTGFCEGVLQKIFLGRTYLSCGRHRESLKYSMLSNIFIFHAGFQMSPHLVGIEKGQNIRDFENYFFLFLFRENCLKSPSYIEPTKQADFLHVSEINLSL